VHNQLRIAQVGIIFCKRKVVQGIQQICFPHTVIAEKAIHFWGKAQFCLFYVLEVQYGYFINNHAQMYGNFTTFAKQKVKLCFR